MLNSKAYIKQGCVQTAFHGGRQLAHKESIQNQQCRIQRQAIEKERNEKTRRRGFDQVADLFRTQRVENATQATFLRISILNRRKKTEKGKNCCQQ